MKISHFMSGVLFSTLYIQMRKIVCVIRGLTVVGHEDHSMKNYLSSKRRTIRNSLTKDLKRDKGKL